MESEATYICLYEQRWFCNHNWGIIEVRLHYYWSGAYEAPEVYVLDSNVVCNAAGIKEKTRDMQLGTSYEEPWQAIRAAIAVFDGLMAEYHDVIDATKAQK